MRSERLAAELDGDEVSNGIVGSLMVRGKGSIIMWLL